MDRKDVTHLYAHIITQSNFIVTRKRKIELFSRMLKLIIWLHDVAFHWLFYKLKYIVLVKFYWPDLSQLRVLVMIMYNIIMTKIFYTI